MNKDNNIVEIKRSETGLGLFATKSIPAKNRIIEYKGRLIPDEIALKSRGRYLFDLENGYSIDGSSRSNLARYINHSCKPNAYAIIEDERIWIWSKRTIEAGEEITIDYGKEYFDIFIKPKGCKCKKCV